MENRTVLKKKWSDRLVMKMNKPEVKKLEVLDIYDALSWLHIQGIYPNARDAFEEMLDSWEFEGISCYSYKTFKLDRHPVMKALKKEFELEGEEVLVQFCW